MTARAPTGTSTLALRTPALTSDCPLETRRFTNPPPTKPLAPVTNIVPSNMLTSWPSMQRRKPARPLKNRRSRRKRHTAGWSLMTGIQDQRRGAADSRATAALVIDSPSRHGTDSPARYASANIHVSVSRKAGVCQPGISAHSRVLSPVNVLTSLALTKAGLTVTSMRCPLMASHSPITSRSE